MEDQTPKKEPFFGPLPNILLFVVFILSLLVVRVAVQKTIREAKATAHTQQAHSAVDPGSAN
jgi:hypothetical protein